MPIDLTWLPVVATTITIILGAIFALVKFIAPLWKRINKWITTWEQFMEDWAGTPEREGRDATPGVMERLKKLDGELSRNGGKSVKDVVNRIEKRQVEGDKIVQELYSRVEQLEEKVL